MSDLEWSSVSPLNLWPSLWGLLPRTLNPTNVFLHSLTGSHFIHLLHMEMRNSWKISGHREHPTESRYFLEIYILLRYIKLLRASPRTVLNTSFSSLCTSIFVSSGDGDCIREHFSEMVDAAPRIKAAILRVTASSAKKDFGKCKPRTWTKWIWFRQIKLQTENRYSQHVGEMQIVNFYKVVQSASTCWQAHYT